MLDEELFESPSDPSDPPSERSGWSSDQRSAAEQVEMVHGSATTAGLEDSAQPLKTAEAAHAEKLPPPRLDQFSLQILRCRVLCPDWRDTAFAPGNPRDADDGPTLVLDVPEFLLQLPPQAPAQHPSTHPVQEHSSGAPTEVLCIDRSEANEELGGARTDALSESKIDGQVLAAGTRLVFHVQVFDPGKGPAYGQRRPFLAVPTFNVLAYAPGQLTDQLSEAGSEHPLLPSFCAEVDSIQMTAEPQTLQVLESAAEWVSIDVAHMLGVPEQQAFGSTQHRSSEQQESSLLKGAPFRLSIRVDTARVRLNGADSGDPPLLVDVHALTAEAARAAHAFTCSVSLERLLMHLEGMPEPKASAMPEPVAALQRPGALKMGRSASAPSPYRHRGAAVLEVQ